MQEIAKQLGVRSILEGGVQRSGDRVRINVQLVDAPTDAPVWAETYDRELIAPNIFAIQSELATAIAGELKASLTPAEQARANAIPTQSLEAWEAYQRGRQRLATRNTAAIRDAEGHFRKAIARDSTFALAWDGLADTLVLQAYYGSRPKNERLTDAEQAVTRALTLEPNLAEGWASAGVIAYQRLDLEHAEQLLRGAIALNPNYAPAHHWLSMTFTDLGRRREALAMAESAVMLDPLSAVINNWLGNARDRVGRFDEALVAYRQAIEIEPTTAIPYVGIGLVYAYGFGRLDSAQTWYERAASADPGNPFALACLAQLYWELGDDTEAERWLARALALGEADVYTNVVAAVLYVDRGDVETAHNHAQVAAELDPWGLFLLRDDYLRKGDYAGARAPYEKALPGLFAKELPTFKERDAFAAIDLAVVLQHTGELSVLPEPIVDLLSGSTATTVDEVSAWGEHVAETLLAMANAKPGPEMGDRPDVERAYCPACGGGTSAAYQRGFQVPEGLLLHLRGERGAHECPVSSRLSAARVGPARRLDRYDVSQAATLRGRSPKGSESGAAGCLRAQELAMLSGRSAPFPRGDQSAGRVTLENSPASSFSSSSWRA